MSQRQTRVSFAKHSSSLSGTVSTASIPQHGSRKASLQLDIIIVGCGLGGLAAARCLGMAGHKIRVVEQAPTIGEVGAGIQVSPNVSRLLHRWGLGDALEKVAVKPEGLVFRRYSDGNQVGGTSWGTSMIDSYNAPYYHVHRADLHKMLLDVASPFMDLHLNSRVSSVSIIPASSSSTGSPRPVIHLENGDSMECDLLIGADGIKSLLRSHVLGSSSADRPRPTGDAAYRAVIPASLLREHDDLRPLLETPEMTSWMGPRRHIMGYCIRNREEYNLVMVHPDSSKADSEEESWTLEGSAEKMREAFADFEPRIQKLLSFIPSTLKWKLVEREPLERWVDHSGRVVLMGDACHPMLPYRAQGAAMAVEDAAVLGNLLSRVESYNQINSLLKAYFELRHPRTTATQLSSRLNQKIFHLPDGPEQRERDRQMEEAMRAGMLLHSSASPNTSISPKSRLHGPKSPTSSTPIVGFKGNPNQWADKEKNMIQFGYDADKAVEEWWDARGKETLEMLKPKGGACFGRIRLLSKLKASAGVAAVNGQRIRVERTIAVLVFVVQCLAVYVFLV